MTSLPPRKEQGFVLLLSMVVLLLVSTIVVLILTQYNVSQANKIRYAYSSVEARQAASAGLEWAMMRLNTEVDSMSFPYSEGPVALNNGATYEIAISSNEDDPEIFTIASTGRSGDDLFVETLYWDAIDVASYSLDMSFPAPIVAKGSVSMSGSSLVTNSAEDGVGDGTKTIYSGGAVAINGGAATASDTGSSDNKGLDNDVVPADSNIGSMNGDEFFEHYMGDTKSAVENSATLVYRDTGDTNYNNRLDGLQNEIVWIDETDAEINSNITIGSEEAPVIVVFTGSFNINGGATIHGAVYAMGSLAMGNGNATINGSVLSEGAVSLSGNITSNGANVDSIEVDSSSDGGVDRHAVITGGNIDY